MDRILVFPHVTAWGGQRRMGAGVGRADEPRLRGPVILMFKNVGQGLAGDHVFMVQAFGNFGDSRAFVLVVTGKQTERFRLVSQSMFKVAVRSCLKALHLVFATEMHFTNQGGGIPVLGKMAGPRGVMIENGPMIPPGGAVLRLFSRQHAHARRCADGGGAVGGVETDGTFRQLVEVPGVDVGIAGEPGYVRAM